jgi:hypothetical protein
MVEISHDIERLDDAVELTTVKPGEHKVRYLGATSGINKNGGDYYQARLEIADDPYTKDFTYYLGLPSSYMDAKQINNTKNNIKDFCFAFGAQPPSTISEFKDLMNGGDLVGMEAWAVLTEKDSDEYGMQNNVKRFNKPV